MKNIYRIIFLLIFNSAFSIYHSFSQQITFQKEFGSMYADIGSSVIQTNDGGYVITGSTYTSPYNSGTFPTDVFLMKTDSYGNIVWSKTFGGANRDLGNSVQQTTDGGYLVAGLTESFGTGIYLIRTDSVGDTLWTKTFENVSTAYGPSCQQTIDGGYIIAAMKGGAYGTYLIKINSNGNLLWKKSFVVGLGVANIITSVQQTNDSGYVITGTTDGGTKDIFLIKTDDVGDTLWGRSFSVINDEESFGVRQTTDGGYIIIGNIQITPAGYHDLLLIKADSIGIPIWTKAFSESQSDFGASIQQTFDGGYIIAGMGGGWGNGNGGPDVYLIKTDANGDTSWTKNIGPIGQQIGGTVQQATDGGYIIVGSNYDFMQIPHIYLIKTDSIGNSGCAQSNLVTTVTTLSTQIINNITTVGNPSITHHSTSTVVGSGIGLIADCFFIGIDEITTDNSLSISPNPLTTQSKITFKNPTKEKFLFTLYDITGRVTESVSTTTNEIILTKGNKPAGVYLFNLVNEKMGERWRGKIVVGN